MNNIKCKNCIHIFIEDGFYKCGFGYPIYKPELKKYEWHFTKINWSCHNFTIQPKGWEVIKQNT